MTDQTAPAAMTSTGVDAITEFLQGSQVAYELIEHKPALSASSEARLTHESPEIVAKTIVLHDGRVYVIAAISAADRLDLHKLRELLGATRQLRLASEAEIARDFPSLEVGAVPPFGPMVPAAEVIDAKLAGQSQILCPAGDNRHSVLLEAREVLRITAAKVADICEE
jgi:Ala-tRNA(Pro) deacylase